MSVITTGEDDVARNELFLKIAEASNPICKNCRHWAQRGRRAGIDRWTEERFGICKLGDLNLSTPLTEWPDAYVWADYDGGHVGDLVTREDFGCNQFKQKE